MVITPILIDKTELEIFYFNIFHMTDRKFDKRDFIRRKRKLILLTEPGEVQLVKDREKKGLETKFYM